MKKTSRREFLKGTLAGAASLTLAGVLGACGTDTQATPTPDAATPTPAPAPTPAAKGIYTPGTSKATAQG